MSNEELINNIVWWIPFKKLRNNIRKLLYRLFPPPPTTNKIVTDINPEQYYNICDLLGYIKYYSNMNSNFSALIMDKLNIIDFHVPIPSHPAEFKMMSIIKYAKLYNCEILIETGTYFGDTSFFCKDYFKQVYTIELSEHLFNLALKRFENYDNVYPLQGDSSIILPTILKEINQKTLFWLDAHYCLDNFTAQGDKDTPIIEELNLILEHSIKDHVILIDDARVFGYWKDYPSINYIKEYIYSKRQNAIFEVRNDMMIIILK